VRFTADAAFREDLETLRCLLSHKVPDGNLTAVLREAVRCAIDKHGKRRGAVKPERPRKPAAPRPRRPGKREPVPVEVKRAAFERDGGRCTYVSPDGRRCDSRWQLELDHVEAAALGGGPAIDNLRLRCKVHNRLHAEETFGPEHMDRFRRQASRTGESTIAGESASSIGGSPGR
jgi:5-methylcytosine-specific restriction endonuclease McrA